MEQIADFVRDNFWICLIVGFIILVVGDEVLGVTKGLFGDAADDYGFSRREQRDIEKTSREAQEDFPDEDDKVSLDDLLGPGKSGKD